MFQDYGLGSEGDDRRLTGAGVGYAYSFNSISDFLLDFRIANSASADDGDDIGVEVDDPTAASSTSPPSTTTTSRR